MTILIKHHLPSSRAALHASWLTMAVLLLILCGALSMTLAQLESIGGYWQSVVATSLALSTAQWLTTATWIQALTHRGPWNGRAFVNLLIWMSSAAVLYGYAIARTQDPIIPALETLNHQPIPARAEGAAFVALCAGLGICLLSITLLMAYLCYLSIRHRRTIG